MKDKINVMTRDVARVVTTDVTTRDATRDVMRIVTREVAGRQISQGTCEKRRGQGCDT